MVENKHKKQTESHTSTLIFCMGKETPLFSIVNTQVLYYSFIRLLETNLAKVVIFQKEFNFCECWMPPLHNVLCDESLGL